MTEKETELGNVFELKPDLKDESKDVINELKIVKQQRKPTRKLLIKTNQIFRLIG